jgi:hypothetical protein
MKKARAIYAAMFCILFLIEVCIALFVHDDFLRPYVGDALVTILLCCLCRTVIPKGLPALPVYVFVFAALVEAAQYVDVVKLLGLEGNAVISTIVGRTFSWADLICYAVGCLVFWLVEAAVCAAWKKKTIRS